MLKSCRLSTYSTSKLMFCDSLRCVAPAQEAREEIPISIKLSQNGTEVLSLRYDESFRYSVRQSKISLHQICHNFLFILYNICLFFFFFQTYTVDVVEPLFGPRSGGTLITMRGSNLEIGSNVNVTVAGEACNIQRFVNFLRTLHQLCSR